MDSLEYLNSMNTRRYRCCCSRIHVKKGALIVGVIELLWTAAIMFTFIAAFAMHTTSKVKISSALFAGALTVGIVYSMAVILMFVGVRKSRPMFLVPHLVIQCLTVLALATLIGLCIAVLALGFFIVEKGDPEAMDPDTTEIFAIVILIISCIMLGFEIWFLNVVYKCYRYLKAKQKYNNVFNKTGALLDDSKPFSPKDPPMPWIDDI